MSIFTLAQHWLAQDPDLKHMQNLPHFLTRQKRGMRKQAQN